MIKYGLFSIININIKQIFKKFLVHEIDFI